MKKQRRKLILIGGISIAALVLLVGVFHQAGYVFSNGFIVKGGTLIIEGARPNSEVYINNKSAGHVNDNGRRTFSGIVPGKREIIVAHEDAWPWIFDFEGIAGETTTLRPLQVTEESEPAVVNVDSDAYTLAQDAFTDYREPSRIAPLERDDVRVWVEGTQILVQRDGDVHTVLASAQPIRNIFWYGERTDAVIVAAAGNVFALDTRKSNTQNYQPIFMGTAPEAVRDAEQPQRVFVRDNGQLLTIDLY